jgi:hypothetical protein
MGDYMTNSYTLYTSHYNGHANMVHRTPYTALQSDSDPDPESDTDPDAYYDGNSDSDWSEYSCTTAECYISDDNGHNGDHEDRVVRMMNRTTILDKFYAKRRPKWTRKLPT